MSFFRFLLQLCFGSSQPQEDKPYPSRTYPIERVEQVEQPSRQQYPPTSPPRRPHYHIVRSFNSLFLSPSYRKLHTVCPHRIKTKRTNMTNTTRLCARKPMMRAIRWHDRFSKVRMRISGETVPLPRICRTKARITGGEWRV